MVSPPQLTATRVGWQPTTHAEMVVIAREGSTDDRHQNLSVRTHSSEPEPGGLGFGTAIEEAVASRVPPVVANITCTTERMCLFNVETDPYEMNDPHALADANPHVVADLLAKLGLANASRYQPGLDMANATEGDWCALVKERKWVEPYCNLTSGLCEGAGGSSGPSPAPPQPPPSGKPSQEQLKAWTGVWQIKQGESASIVASKNGFVQISATRCPHCCWSSAAGTVGSNDAVAITLVDKMGQVCGKTQYNGLRDGTEIRWEHWTSQPWRKLYL